MADLRVELARLRPKTASTNVEWSQHLQRSSKKEARKLRNEATVLAAVCNQQKATHSIHEQTNLLLDEEKAHHLQFWRDYYSKNSMIDYKFSSKGIVVSGASSLSPSARIRSQYENEIALNSSEGVG